MSRLRSSAALLGVVALAACVRLYDLEMDPPFIGSSMGEYADAGNYLAQARSYAQTGEWKLTEFPTYYASPLHNYFVLIAFCLLGVGTVSSVIPSVLAGIGSVGMILLSARELGKRMALLGGVLLGTDFVFVAYNRLNKQESLVAFFALLAFYGTLRSPYVRHASLLALTAGFAALLTKLTGLWVLVAVLAALWEMDMLRVRRVRFEIAAAFVLFAVAYGGVLVALSSAGLLSPMFSAYSVHSRTLMQVLADLAVADQTLFSSTLFLRSPLTVFGLLAAAALWTRNPACPPRERALAAFVVLGLGAVAFYHYAPLRFRVPLIPFGILAVLFFMNRSSGPYPAWRRWLFGHLIFSGIGFTLSWRYGLGWSPLAIRFCSALLALATIPRWVSIPIKKSLVAILLLGVVYQGVQIVKAYTGRTHELASIYSDVARTLNGGTLNGEVAYWARNVALNANIRLVTLADDPEWFLLEEETEREPFLRACPEVFKELVIVRKYPIDLLQRTLVLYRRNRRTGD